MVGWAIALHGGCGDIHHDLPDEQRIPREIALRHCLDVGVSALRSGKPPLDVVELLANQNILKNSSSRALGQNVFEDYDRSELENHPKFNAGKGSVLTNQGSVEMDASIMDGKTTRCGAVSGLSTVIDKTPHVYLAFDGAETFARAHDVETVDSSYFITPENIERLKQAKEFDRVQLDYTRPTQKEPENYGSSQKGTVGCVAVDRAGNLASATSTGGVVNKMPGRIGDTAIIGAGTYANHLCAVSATGQGEEIIRGTVAKQVAALMEYKGLSLTEAAAYAIDHSVPKDTCGLIAVSADGQVTMPFNTRGMFRACATEDGYTQIGIWRKSLTD